jgi:hypothetical protein
MAAHLLSPQEISQIVTALRAQIAAIVKLEIQAEVKEIPYRVGQALDDAFDSDLRDRIRRIVHERLEISFKEDV